MNTGLPGLPGNEHRHRNDRNNPATIDLYRFNDRPEATPQSHSSRRTTAERPQNNRRTTAERPQNDRRTTAEQPQNNRRTTAERPQNYCITTV